MYGLHYPHEILTHQPYDEEWNNLTKMQGDNILGGKAKGNRS